jgi:hypothetical protein
MTLTTHPHLVPWLSMSRSYTSSPPMCLHGMQRDSFTFFFSNTGTSIYTCWPTCPPRIYLHLDVVIYIIQILGRQLTPWNRVLLEKLIVRSARQEIPRLLQNPTVYYCVHNSPPLVLIPNQINPIHTPNPISLISILIFSHLSIRILSGLFPSDIPTKIMYVFLTSPCALHSPPIPTSLNWPF